MKKRQLFTFCSSIAAAGLTACQPANGPAPSAEDTLRVEGTNLNQAMTDGNGLGQNGLGKNGLGQNGLGKNGLGKNGLGKNGFGQNGLGKNGLDSNNGNYSSGEQEFAFLNGFYYSEMFSNSALRDQLFKYPLSNDLDTNAARVELKREIFRGLRVASHLSGGLDYQAMTVNDWNSVLYSSHSNLDDARVAAGKSLWSALVFDYLVRGVSAADVTLNFSAGFLARYYNSIWWISPADTFTFAKQQSLCNGTGKWGTTGAIDESCAKLVSAYLAIVNNGGVDPDGLTVHVPLSLRNPVANSGPGTLNPSAYATRVPQFPYRKGRGANVASSLACQDGQGRYGLTRDCSWQQGDAFVCKRGANVSITASSTTQTLDTMMRICKGMHMCDSAEALAANDDISTTNRRPAISFTCGTGYSAGTAGNTDWLLYSFQYARYDASTDDSISQADYNTIVFSSLAQNGNAACSNTYAGACAAVRAPAREQEVFRSKEGSFFGNIFLGISTTSTTSYRTTSTRGSTGTNYYYRFDTSDPQASDPTFVKVLNNCTQKNFSSTYYAFVNGNLQPITSNTRKWCAMNPDSLDSNCSGGCYYNTGTACTSSCDMFGNCTTSTNGTCVGLDLTPTAYVVTPPSGSANALAPSNSYYSDRICSRTDTSKCFIERLGASTSFCSGTASTCTKDNISYPAIEVWLPTEEGATL